MQTILGANGAIGIELAKSLKEYTDQIRLVSRNPQRVNETDQILHADLTEIDQVMAAVAGSEIVYLTVGLPYKLAVWEIHWPKIMRNVLDACIAHQAKLVFFDNVYMYDKNEIKNMTEESRINPPSQKGKVRAQIAQMLLNEIKAGHLEALIARSADFAGFKNSALGDIVYTNLKKGKKAQWLINADVAHNFTFVPEAAWATALLGNTPEAYGQVWHLPTDRAMITGRQWVSLFASAMEKNNQVAVLPKWALALLGIFIPTLRELKEMAYQYDRDYFFNSSKFETKFNYKPLSAKEIVEKMVAMGT